MVEKFNAQNLSGNNPKTKEEETNQLINYIENNRDKLSVDERTAILQRVVELGLITSCQQFAAAALPLTGLVAISQSRDYGNTLDSNRGGDLAAQLLIAVRPVQIGAVAITREFDQYELLMARERSVGIQAVGPQPRLAE